MSHLASIRQTLESWSPLSESQRVLRDDYLTFLQTTGAAGLERAGDPRHLTASCFVFSPDFRQILLCFHGKGNFWVQLGGHLEPDDASLAAAALRECREESGLEQLELLSPLPRDLDLHPLSSAFGSCRAHFDVGMAAIADPTAPLVISSESRDLRWWPVDGLPPTAAPSMPTRITQTLREIRAQAELAAEA
ncbi:NUDIX hydrolase [Psychromicrobium xiongbiense]|uniref:NUDIX hydrolase n=1 Tax=Psychromicrobium xiongbiense TaxID=3051184 RepID=UPI002553E832|nr:NUDIX domain-containing protein [Psychromicrobium sp. YIM S02556]